MGIYTNADGLQVITGKAEGNVHGDGFAPAVEKFLVFDLDDATELGTAVTSFWNYQSELAAGDANVDKPALNAPYIPANAFVTRAWTVVDAAFTSGGSATLNVGLYQKDGTVIDADGIDATIAVATLAADVVVPADGALADGTQNVGANDAYVGVDYDTAAFTAGSAKLVIGYVEVI